MSLYKVDVTAPTVPILSRLSRAPMAAYISKKMKVAMNRMKASLSLICPMIRLQTLWASLSSARYAWAPVRQSYPLRISKRQ